MRAASRACRPAPLPCECTRPTPWRRISRTSFRTVAGFSRSVRASTTDVGEGTNRSNRTPSRGAATTKRQPRRRNPRRRARARAAGHRPAGWRRAPVVLAARWPSCAGARAAARPAGQPRAARAPAAAGARTRRTTEGSGRRGARASAPAPRRAGGRPRGWPRRGPASSRRITSGLRQVRQPGDAREPQPEVVVLGYRERGVVAAGATSAWRRIITDECTKTLRRISARRMSASPTGGTTRPTSRPVRVDLDGAGAQQSDLGMGVEERELTRQPLRKRPRRRRRDER